MLALGMKRGERVYLNVPPGWSGQIVVQVVDTKPGNVKVGFSAPRDVEILREKVLDRREGHKWARRRKYRGAIICLTHGAARPTRMVG